MSACSKLYHSMMLECRTLYFTYLRKFSRYTIFFFLFTSFIGFSTVIPYLTIYCRHGIRKSMIYRYIDIAYVRKRKIFKSKKAHDVRTVRTYVDQQSFWLLKEWTKECTCIIFPDSASRKK